MRDEDCYKLKREDFTQIADEELLGAALAWVYGKTLIVEPSRHLDVLMTLPKPCQYLMAVNAIDNEMSNFGFHQYYSNQSNILTVSAYEALTAIGANTLAEIAKRADMIYEQIKSKFYDCFEDSMANFDDYYKDNPLNELDEEYYAPPEYEQTVKLLIAYIKANIDCFGD
ncbi:MAG: DMP19 family protein [Defluviitaleaceae bacterium]|nr:DMP19 family protein [Defluviitaleaceae bacterium]